MKPDPLAVSKPQGRCTPAEENAKPAVPRPHSKQRAAIVFIDWWHDLSPTYMIATGARRSASRLIRTSREAGG